MKAILPPRAPDFRGLLGLLDRSLARLSSTQPTAAEVKRLRWFWLDGLFNQVSLSFYANFIGLFALAYGANNAQIGRLTAIASLCGMIALLPGAQAVKWMGGRRKAVVLLSGGVVGRVPMLAWLILPWAIQDGGPAVAIIIAVYAVITFANNFANPAWTALVADIVPKEIRGRFFGHRNFAVNLPTLLLVPLAGWLIQVGNRPAAPFAGYQIVFALAFLSGILATLSYARIDEPRPSGPGNGRLPLGEVSRIIRAAPGFASLVVCTLIWNLGTQMNAPFLNVYLVTDLGATTTDIGWVTAAGSLTTLLTLPWLGKWVDRRGNVWVQGLLSFIITGIPIAWMLSTAAWQVIIINAIAGVLWTAYGLASFNLLLELAPEEARTEASALFQFVIAASAVIAPVIGGHIADAFGYRPIFLISAVLRILGALTFLLWVARPAVRRARQTRNIT